MHLSLQTNIQYMVTIKTDSNGGLVVESGHYTLTASYTQNQQLYSDGDRQHVMAIVSAEVGHFRLNPFWGCDLMQQVNAPGLNKTSLSLFLKKRIEATGFYSIKTQDIIISQNTINISKFYRIKK